MLLDETDLPLDFWNIISIWCGVKSDFHIVKLSLQDLKLIVHKHSINPVFLFII